MGENILNIIREELALILENRIDKLRREKYSEDVINFAYEFAKLTTKDPSQEENLLRNQYIPWIAQEIRKNPAITNEKDKLDTIINWIKQTNYQKISTNDSFDTVFEKAKTWLSKRNIEPASGERLEGGRVIKTYPNGFKWVRVTNINWCMNVGEKYGWCFSSPDRAETFVGLGKVGASNQGYMLLSGKDKPLLAVQYNPEDKKIEDIQAPHNQPAKPEILKYGFELFGTIGKITDITSHQNNFWKTLNENPKLKDEFMNIPTVHLDIKTKLDRGLPLSPEERSSLDLNDLLKYKVPLTPEEIISVPIELKLKYGIQLSNQEKNLLKTSKDLFIAKLWRASQSRSYEKIFTEEDFAGYNAYEFDYNKRAVKLDIAEDEFDEKFSGLYEQDLSIYSMVNGYDYYENVDGEESDYMNGYLNEKNEKLLKKIASQLGVPDYNFEEEGNLARFIKEYTDIRIEDDFLNEVGYGRARNAIYKVNKKVKEEQKFKYDNNYLVLPFKELYKFVSEHPEKNIKTFNELKDAEINGKIEIEDLYYQENTQIDVIAEKKINILFKEKLTEFLEKIESGEINIVTGVKRAKEILKILGFKKLENFYFHGHNFPGFIHAVRKGGRAVFVLGMDFEKEQYKVKIMDFGKSIRKDAKPKKVLEGNIPFERLADYVYQHELFETVKLREFIQQVISEDFRYLYDKKTFKPSADVINTVRVAIGIAERNRLSDTGSNEGSGIQKAKSIVAGEPMTHAQLKRMKAFFDNNLQAVRAEISGGKTIYNSGLIQSWNLWGGDVGKRWVEQNISSVQSSNKTSKKVRNPEDGIRTKTLMDPHNTRIHRESYINDKGELMGLDINDEPAVSDAERVDDADFTLLVKKYGVSGNPVAENVVEYWFPEEAEEELNTLGIDWYTRLKVANPNHQNYNKMFLVFTYIPHKPD